MKVRENKRLAYPTLSFYTENDACICCLPPPAVLFTQDNAPVIGFKAVSLLNITRQGKWGKKTNKKKEAR